MNLLVVCQYYYPEPFRITDICESLVKRGHAVTVLTGLPNYPEGKVPKEYRNFKKREEIINGVRVIRSFEIGRGKSNLRLLLNYFSFAISGSLKAFNLKGDFDFILVNQLSPVMMAIPGIIYKKFHNKKLLLYCLDLWPASLQARGIKEDSFVHKVFLKISKWIYNSADSILISSGMFKQYFYDDLSIKNKTFIHLPQYAEEIFSGNIDFKSHSGKYNFVFAGNIGDMQSVETILYAARELSNQKDITFHIVGDGSKLADCKHFAKEMNLENVVFYGRRPVEEMPEFYSMADAMLITLKSDKIISYTLPGKVQSYMAAGKPIIGAIDGETNVIINNAKCGICCDAENYTELAQNIMEFIKSENKIEMGINSLSFYKNNYNKEKFIKTLENALTDMEATTYV